MLLVGMFMRHIYGFKELWCCQPEGNAKKVWIIKMSHKYIYKELVKLNK